MRKDIQKMDFEQMAKESHRKYPVPEDRNNDIYDLILKGKQEMEW